MSRLNFKKMGIVLLIMVLLILASACSGVLQLQDGKKEPHPVSPDVENVQNKEDSKKDGDPDRSQGNEESGANITDNPTKEDAQVDAETDPEKILEGYYYGIVDKPIVDFELEDLDGNNVRLSDYKGKVVFLNFWATWCPPCREEMPYMQAFYEKYKDKDVVILAVNPSSTENRGLGNSKKAEEKVRKFIEDEGYTFPILLDRDDSVWAVYQQRGIPANYMIDKEGIVRYLKPGAFMNMEEMEAFAKALGGDIN